MQLLRDGQRDLAFAALLSRYQNKIYRLCVALLHDHAQAEDVAQESLVRIWKSLHRYDGRASPSTWIYAITRNRCLTALQRRRTESARQGALAALDALESDMPDSGADWPQSRPSEPDALAAAQRDQQLRTLVDALPERLRRVLVLYYFEEQSIEAVARMLSCPEGTVKTQLFRARAALAEQLRRFGVHDARAWLEEGHGS